MSTDGIRWVTSRHPGYATRTMDPMAILPTPAALFELGRAAFGRVLESTASLATVPVRVLGLLGQMELLVNRMTVLAEDAEKLIRRVSGVVDDVSGMVDNVSGVVDNVSGVVADAEETARQARAITEAARRAVDEMVAISGAASAVVGRADAATADAQELLSEYGPTLRRAAPLAARFVEELSPEEVTAAIRMVDTLPRLRAHLVDDVMPLLGKLDQVGPDIHKLLEVTEDLHLAIAGLPGLKMLRRRGEDRSNNGSASD